MLQLSDDEITDIPRRIAREVLTAGNLDVVDDLLDADFVDHNAFPGVPAGPEGFKQAVQVLRTAFPNLVVTPQQYIVDGRWSSSTPESIGTHDGPFFGLPPTHTPVSISAIVTLRLNDEGKIVERWGQFNLLGILQQLGVVPGGPVGAAQAAPLAPVAGLETAGPEYNRSVFARYVHGVWGRGDESIASEVIDPHAVTPYNPRLPAGPAGALAWVGLLRTAFPDLRVTLEAMVGDERLVCGRMLLEGTHHGAFLGVPPTGTPVSIEQMALARMSGGRIVATWFETDLAGAMRQLGVMPG